MIYSTSTRDTTGFFRRGGFIQCKELTARLLVLIQRNLHPSYQFPQIVRLVLVERKIETIYVVTPEQDLPPATRNYIYMFIFIDKKSHPLVPTPSPPFKKLPNLPPYPSFTQWPLSNLRSTLTFSSLIRILVS